MFIDPKVDLAFKWLFGQQRNAQLLVLFLNAVLENMGIAEIMTIEVLNPYSQQDSLDDKLSIVDIKAVDDQGRLTRWKHGYTFFAKDI